jgi:hypothetical protein
MTVINSVSYFVSEIGLNANKFYVGDVININGTVGASFVDVSIQVWNGALYNIYNITSDVTGHFSWSYTTSYIDIGSLAFSVYHYDTTYQQLASVTVSGKVEVILK